MTTNDVFQAALKLPKRTRAKLADRLLESLKTNDAIDAAIEEAEKNWQAYKRGEMKGRPVEEVFPDLDGARLAHKRIQACLEGKENSVP
jgi:hypothetical protein